MNLPIKLISTDFDGTLFAEFHTPPIPKSIVSLIGDLQAKGAKWVINTGRDMSSLMECMARSGLTIQPDYLVIVEREIYAHDGNRYVGHKEWNQACSRDHAELFQRIRPEVPKLMDWVNERFKATVYEDPYSPFCLIARNNGDADVIYDYLSDFCKTVPDLTVVRNDVYARFSHTRYNKGTALAELTKMLGFTRKGVFAAGDHFNDLPMLSLDYANWLVSPHNAMESVKEVVRRQNGHVSKLSFGEGVADGLRLVLGQNKNS